MNDIEHKRLIEVNEFLKLDFANSEFQDIAELASELCEKPVALITLLDDESNWFKVRVGTDLEVMPRETSFCQYGIQEDDLMIVPDTLKDERFINNPLVSSNPNLRFYAGAPLKLSNGLKLGTLCLFDQKPSTLTSIQQKTLKILAKQVIVMMELKMNQLLLQQQIEETEAKNDSLVKIAQLQSHQIRQPLTTLMGLINLIKEDCQKVDENWLKMFEIATNNFDTTIYDIIAESIGNKDLRAIRFNKMVEEIDDYAILLLDDIGTVENWNKGAQKIKGYNQKEIIGKNFSVFYTDVDRNNDKPSKLIAEAREIGVAKDEGWRLRKDGSKFWGSMVITAIHNDTGDVIGFTKVTRDLTDIKAAEEARAISSDMYEMIADKTSQLVRVGGWELDLLSNSLSWTSMTKHIHGLDDDFVPEFSTAINFYKEGDSRTQITNAINLAINQGIPWDLDLQIVTKQGEYVWVNATGKSNYKDGICTKVYGTFQDISESKTKV